MTEELARFLERPVADLEDRAAAHLHVPCLAPQPRAVALRARLRIQILGQLLAHHDRVGLAIAPLEVGNDAFEGVLAHRRLATVGKIGERDLFLIAAIQHHLLDFLGQLREWLVQVEAVMLGQALQHLEIELVAAIPAFDRAGCERKLRKGDDALGVEETDRTQAVAARARAHRIVEGEQARLELLQRVAADRARELGGIQVLLTRVHFDRDGAAVAVAQCGLERLRQPLLEIRPDAQPVDDDFDRVLLVLGELRDRIDLVHLAVDAHAHEALGAQLDEQFELFAFAVHHRRREDHQLGFLGHHQHRVDHLRDRHRGELLLRVVGAERLADAGVEQAQVIVDFGDGADGRARVVRRRLLLDRNRRREAFDQIDVGLFHQLQELPRVGRQRLDVAPLSLGVQRVEGERALARAGEPGDDDQPVSRQIEVDVLEVVRSGAADADVFHVLPARRSGLR